MSEENLVVVDFDKPGSRSQSAHPGSPRSRSIDIGSVLPADRALAVIEDIAFPTIAGQFGTPSQTLGLMRPLGFLVGEH